MFGRNSDDNSDGQGPEPLDAPAATPFMPVTPAHHLQDQPEHTAHFPAMAEPHPVPPAPTTHTHQPDPTDDLVHLKQQALDKLTPLVQHLDQTPEERFKTTMMMLQASDNSKLVKQAYHAAEAITDDKARAQALLDVVNEINYFTHHETNND